MRCRSHRYHKNAHGSNNLSPRWGRFSSTGYFYRAAETVLDVHQLDPPGIFADGFESGDTSAWVP